MGFSRRHINSEEDQFKTLLDTYNHQLFSQIAQKIQDRENAKDVLQNILVHLWQYRHLMYTGNWEHIVFKTYRQEIAAYYRKNKHTYLTERLDDTLDGAEDDLIFAEQKEELLSALEESIHLIIPPIRQTIFRMNKLQGIRQAQIALMFEISVRSVENHISQAMIFLKSINKKS